MSIFNRCISALFFLIAAQSSSAAIIDLYDGGLGNSLSSQGWLYLDNPLFGSSATRTQLTDGVRLDSTVQTSDSAGFFSSLHPSVPVFSANDGFTVSFSSQLLEENHFSSDRAGFSVIVLDQQSVGIELGFWSDRVWAQNDTPLFTHGEEQLFDTSVEVIYDLVFDANNYQLFADSNLILSGAARDYSAHSSNVYSSTNFLFFGDDTSSANADVVLRSISFDTGSAVPLPSVFLLMLPFLALLRRVAEI